MERMSSNVLWKKSLFQRPEISHITAVPGELIIRPLWEAQKALGTEFANQKHGGADGLDAF